MSAVRYFVRDVQEAIEFYRDVLAFELITQYGPAMAIVRRGELTLWLAGPRSSAAQPTVEGETPSPGGWNRIVVLTEDLRSKLADIEAAGCKIRVPLRTGPGGSQLVIQDPSGNCIELFEEA
ncbi:VOC family protein [Mesorhizobium sp. M1C.F.Ca.ET.193.01.1.1]|uniref:VOC family protein n=2 Tax=Mesorhizobium TaxID=68287 RepID=UPI000FD2D978|nr:MULTISPECIES: VOC family protein [unclassified Mesorhizobium]TGS94496.1 VOC family protein [bacterium M00.F.Ca.ET.177.01.1.1]TGQ51198.1 VOC family protein [Mesorhizobium sp. M1C.F.Ca.ET.210.01.1.1]TGQ66986.1 VOC family protein [Mesorhizobium sp. M1C.F.Ca.ET.212.01.1.1]TGR01109.1 VOC family protein [Mesorhizobium sp. M1C.F.Ca.ET.204.01.1.1]TGR21788.1 VOC family protein [Mesorhizobium sp. M1C.F.Ca.ET.196.01.1.1]